MNQLEKIVLVELNPRLPTAGSLLLMPRHGALVVGSKLKEAGYDVKFLYEPFFKEITADTILEYQPDLVAFSAITASVSKVKRIAQELFVEEIPVLVGGEHASMFPDTIDFADYVVINEGEAVAAQLLNALNNDDDLSTIPNLRYKTASGYIQNAIMRPEEMPVDFSYDLSIIEGLDSLNPLKRFMLRLSLQTSRGCPYLCKFCVTKDLLGRKYRRRSIEDVLSDIESGMSRSITSFMIVDNHFGIGYDETKKLLEAIISQDYDASFTALVRSDITQNQDIIRLMKKAGIHNVCIGIESVNNNSLAEWNKGQKIEDIQKALLIFHEHGISVLGLFMAGADHDTVDDIKQIPEFAIKNKIDKIQISPWTIKPFNKEYQHRLIPGVPFDYCNGHFVIIFPLQMRPSTLQIEIAKAYKEFYSIPGVFEALTHASRRFNAFYGRLTMMYAERFVVNGSVQHENYIDLLKQKEKDLYDGNLLIESKLRQENIKEAVERYRKYH